MNNKWQTNTTTIRRQM